MVLPPEGKRGPRQEVPGDTEGQDPNNPEKDPLPATVPVKKGK